MVESTMEHRTRTIARGPNTRIDRCTCGAIHLHVGATTLRLSEAVARELAKSLALGFAQLDTSANSSPAPQPAFRVVSPSDDDDGQLH